MCVYICRYVISKAFGSRGCLGRHQEARQGEPSHINRSYCLPGAVGPCHGARATLGRLLWNIRALIFRHPPTSREDTPCILSDRDHKALDRGACGVAGSCAAPKLSFGRPALCFPLLLLGSQDFIIDLERQVAQNDRRLYPKVAHRWDKVAPNYGLPAFQVLERSSVQRQNYHWHLHPVRLRPPVTLA